MLRGNRLPDVAGTSTETNAPAFLDNCLEDKIRESIKILGEQGGNINPKLYKTFKFNEEAVAKDISYLCYNQNYYQPCITQEPMLKKHLEDEIKNYISSKVKNCFSKLSNDLSSQGFVVDAKYTDFKIDLLPKRIIVDINAKLILTKSGETSIQQNFKVIIPSRFYELVDIAQEITKQQAKYCSFNKLGYMLLYPEYSINDFMTGDSTIIYTLEHRKTKERFRFAIRGCVIAAGF